MAQALGRWRCVQVMGMLVGVANYVTHVTAAQALGRWRCVQVMGVLVGVT